MSEDIFIPWWLGKKKVPSSPPQPQVFYFVYLILCSCYRSVSLPNGAMGWSVIVTLGGHTHLLFDRYMPNLQ